MNDKSFTPHGRGVRGITLPRSSLLFEGRFGRIFRALPPAEFGDNDKETLKSIHTLAKLMVGPDDKAKDGADPEESGIPALYTYLGQFIDHDLTFDPASSLQQQNDIDALTDYRTPRFDLDNIYGRGPDDQPYLYHKEEGRAAPKLLLGDELTGGTLTNPPAADLPRNPKNKRAIIGDPRNDENLIVSQLQGLFYRFHNRFVDEHPAMHFQEVQRQVRFHYQWMLVNDFLPTLISKDVCNAVFPHLGNGGGASIANEPPRLRFYHAKNEAFMPPESDWGIDWGRFIDIDDRPNGVMLDDDGNVSGTNPPRKPTKAERDVIEKRLQLAYRIDTSVSKPLSDLPPDVADLILKSLIERNLIRGWRLRLPSGQDVARAMGILPLEVINIGKFEDAPSGLTDLNDNAIAGLERFRDNCPLWVYILAETFNHTTEGKFGAKSKQLGPLGGTIVAETFAGLLLYDSHSFLNLDPRWTPEISDGMRFGLKEFVSYALGM